MVDRSLSQPEIIQKALAHAGLDPSYARTVEALIGRVQDDWRLCCGSGCEPCVVPLGVAVDYARRALGINGPES